MSYFLFILLVIVSCGTVYIVLTNKKKLAILKRENELLGRLLTTTKEDLNKKKLENDDIYAVLKTERIRHEETVAVLKETRQRLQDKNKP